MSQPEHGILRDAGERARGDVRRRHRARPSRQHSGRFARAGVRQRGAAVRRQVAGRTGAAAVRPQQRRHLDRCGDRLQRNAGCCRPRGFRTGRLAGDVARRPPAQRATANFRDSRKARCHEHPFSSQLPRSRRRRIRHHDAAAHAAEQAVDAPLRGFLHRRRRLPPLRDRGVQGDHPIHRRSGAAPRGQVPGHGAPAASPRRTAPTRRSAAASPAIPAAATRRCRRRRTATSR